MLTDFIDDELPLSDAVVGTKIILACGTTSYGFKQVTGAT
jgi:hypothetical protein